MRRNLGFMVSAPREPGLIHANQTEPQAAFDLNAAFSTMIFEREVMRNHLDLSNALSPAAHFWDDVNRKEGKKP